MIHFQKSILYLIIASNICINLNLLNAQDNKATLSLDKIIISKDGGMTASDDKAIYQSEKFGNDWKIVSSIKKDEDSDGSEDINDYSFFNRDTFILSGYMYDKLDGDSYVLRTTNGGRNFKKIYFPNTKSNNYIDAAYCNKDGQIWLSFPDNGFYYSADFGIKWRNIGKLPEQRIRASSLFFRDSLMGLISVGSWGLYLTEDNCNSFKNVSTPFDQKKVAKIFASSDPPSIYDVLIYDSLLLANCKNRWFYTKHDKINWEPLLNISNIYLNKENNQLWGVSNDNHILLFDNQLNIAWQSPTSFKNTPYNLTSANGILYFLSGESLYKIKNNEISHTPNYLKDKPIEVKLENRSKATFITWGWDSYNLYHSRDLGKTWYRIKELDNAIWQVNAINDTIAILYNQTELKRYEYNFQSNTIKPYHLTNVLDDFIQKRITEFSIGYGSYGCFHSYGYWVDYKLNKEKPNKFIGKIRYENQSEVQVAKTKVPAYTNICSYSAIESLLNNISREPERNITNDDFDFKEADKQEYLIHLKSILKNKNKGQDEENFYKAIPFDTIRLSFFENIINERFSDSLFKLIFFNNDNVFSTTTNWVKFHVKNTKGEEFDIENNDYLKNPYFLPWQGTFKNINFKTADIRIFESLSTLTPSDFWDEVPNKKLGSVFGNC